jgi:acyl-CoA reductase-like NAD-dependent aldehyde dehydrogenase
VRNLQNLCIDGVRVDPFSTSTRTVVKPADKIPIADISTAGPEDINREVATAKAALEEW